MPRYLVVDANNLIQRCCHVVKNAPDQREWMGRIYTIIFHSIVKLNNLFLPDHVVTCFDAHSWREEVYQIYKENRKFDPEANIQKYEMKKISHMIIAEFVEYLRDKTNITVLEGNRIEADDFVARWIQRHQDRLDSHIIVSNDADFKQLVAPGVDLYDPIPNVLYTTDGVYYKDDRQDALHPSTTRYGEVWKIKYSQPKTSMVYRYNFEQGKGEKDTFTYPVTPYPQGDGILVFDVTQKDTPIRATKIVGEKKGWEYLSGTRWLEFPVLTETNPLVLYPYDKIRLIQSREIFDPKWELFVKCIRGDIRDNIKPAFLRVPETRLRKAYSDKEEYVKLINDSFNANDEKKEVRPLFELNKMLIDLTAQPNDVISSMDEIIDEMIEQPPREMVEIYFNGFCDLYKNRRLRELKPMILPILSRPYRR